jgi:Tfp pilus assembly protein PilE
MASLTKRIAAHTLVETIISMAIVMFVFGIAMMIYINVVRTDRIMQRTEVFFKINEILFEAKQTRNYTDKQFEFDTFEIHQKVEAYSGCKNIKKLTVLAVDVDGKLIAEKSELIITSNEKD